MIRATFADIDIAKLSELITEGRGEDQTIEYKGVLPSGAESEKVKLLLKPVCSFANTEGGDLVFGVVADAGLPRKLEGVSDPDVDQTILRLDAIIRSGIEPHVGGIQIKAVTTARGTHVFVVRVTKSWVGPHRVVNNRTFYGRGAAGAFELDVPHVRQAFLLSNTAQQDIRRFREERLSKLLSGDTPVRLHGGATTILHVLPLQSFVSGRMMSIAEMEPDIARLAHPQYKSGINWTIGLDGMTVYDVRSDGISLAYSQLFRQGQVELVEAFPPERSGGWLPSTVYEKAAIDFTSRATEFLKNKGFGGPMFVAFALMNASGFKLGISQTYEFTSGRKARPFDKNVLIFSIVELPDPLGDVGRHLRPIFDQVWNASGFAKCLNYDPSGGWRPQTS